MTTDFEVDAKDFARAAEALSAAGFKDVADPLIGLAIHDIGVIVRRKVRLRLLSHYRTGKLRSGVVQVKGGSGIDTVGIVKSTGPIAHLIAGGVKPHTIRSHKHMPIRGFGGITTFAQTVHHPGFRGDPYFHKGVEDAARDIDKIVVKATDTMAIELKARIER
jgi:hypothetical protein